MKIWEYFFRTTDNYFPLWYWPYESQLGNYCQLLWKLYAVGQLQYGALKSVRTN